MIWQRRVFLAWAAGVAVLCGALHGATSPDYSHDIEPILSDNCYQCHGPDSAKRKAGLRLDQQDSVLAPHEGHIAIVPGDIVKSELVTRVLSSDPDEQMPPPKSERTLTGQQKELLRRWVEAGAAWGKHWSLLPPQRPALPEVKNANWCRNPIDRFVLATLEAEGLKPSPEADKTTLIRRVTLELTGLPPTPKEVDDFLLDNSKDAYERVVNRLLASPRYGERMVWEWLDAARYADTNGYQGDQTRTMWPWRDWAVKALNDNMPFDRFTVEQLAGDLLPGATQEDKLATGFCRNHMINGEGGRIPDENRVDYVMDQEETTATVWLGLTVGCARCHDHKYDPITQKDYYSLFAFFNNTPVDGSGGSGQTKPVIDFTTPEQKATLDAAQARIKDVARDVTVWENELFPREEGKPVPDSPNASDLPGDLIPLLKLPPERRYNDGLVEAVNFYKTREPAYHDALQTLLEAIRKRDQVNASLPRVMVMEEMPQPRKAFVLTKGAYDKPTTEVTANTLSCLEPLPAGAPHNRLGLATWLVSPDNPLTARVTVNRYWQQFFGTGIVKTVSDFGVQGEKPSHPELLDWLACEFVSNGWNVKAIHRLILTSATYRQSSKVTPDLVERDPENRLLARGPRFRLPSFVIRDQALAASGLLVEKLGGPPVKTYQPPGVWEEATFGQIKFEQEHGDALYRRSLYTFWRRIVAPTEFFDVASRQVCTVKQSHTNTPLHALVTLDDTTFVEAARALAQRVMKAQRTPEERIDLAYRLVLARKPSADERGVLMRGLDRLKSQYGSNPQDALKLLSVGESKRDESLDAVEHASYAGVCAAILNLDETLTKE